MLQEVDGMFHHLTDLLFGLLTVPLGRMLGLTVLLEPTGRGDTAHHLLKAGLTFTLSLC